MESKGDSIKRESKRTEESESKDGSVDTSFERSGNSRNIPSDGDC